MRGPASGSRTTGLQRRPPRSRGAPLYPPARNRAWPADSELQPTRLLVPVERVPQPFFQARGRAEAKLAAGAAGGADPTCAAGFQPFVARQDAPPFAEGRPPQIGREACRERV